MINLLSKKEECCGCSACMNICPKNAISMEKDQEGFLYPQIDSKLCIECHLCEKVCFYKTGYNLLDVNLEKPETYAVMNKDNEVRLNSQSGGMFTAISDEIIKLNGVVYGTGYDENFHVYHKRAETKEQRDEFRGSKYVQSNLNNTFKKVKKDLETGRKVLFTGTPCQIAGLVKYLENKRADNLLLVDIVCHGVPSPSIWSDYLQFLSKKYDGKIEGVNFRDKDFGWHSHIETISIKGKKNSSDFFSKLFYEHVMLRPSCHNCMFTNLKRASDVTICDCWGIEKNMPQVDDNKGVSLVMINTKQGKQFVQRTLSKINSYDILIDHYLQPQMQHPVEASARRDEFWHDYQIHSFEYILKKYAGYGFKEKFKRKSKKVLSGIKIVRWIWKKVKKYK